jgi:hypothetical protein
MCVHALSNMPVGRIAAVQSPTPKTDAKPAEASSAKRIKYGRTTVDVSAWDTVDGASFVTTIFDINLMYNAYFRHTPVTSPACLPRACHTSGLFVETAGDWRWTYQHQGWQRFHDGGLNFQVSYTKPSSGAHLIHWCTAVHHIPNGLVAMISA